MDILSAQAISAGGMTSAISRAADASIALLNASAPSSGTGSPVSTARPQKAGAVVADLVANAVQLMGAVYALRMNKVAFQAADSMTGGALSLKA